MRQQMIVGTLAFGFGLVLSLSFFKAHAEEFVLGSLAPPSDGRAFPADPPAPPREASVPSANEEAKAVPGAEDGFSRALQRRLLTDLSRDITEAFLGDDEAGHGSFRVDDMLIGFETIGEEIEMTITDGDGATTRMSLRDPRF